MKHLAIAALSLLALVSLRRDGPDAKVVVRSRYDASPGGVFCGSLSGVRGGGSHGVTFVVAGKGDRIFWQFADTSEILSSAKLPGAAWIVDAAEERTYRLNPMTREYSVQTFGEVSRKIAGDHSVIEDAALASGDELPSTGVEPPAQSRRRARRFEYEASVRETGQHRTIAGFDARELVLTLTAHERGKSLGNDGGWVATSSMWLGPRLMGVDRLVAAQRRYTKAVTKGIYDAVFTETELNGDQLLDPCMPEHVFVAARVIHETEQLDGTALAASTVYQMERTAREYERALAQYEAQQRRLTGSGARVLGGVPPKRTTLITMAFEYLSISNEVTDADVSIPSGFSRKR